MTLDALPRVFFLSPMYPRRCIREACNTDLPQRPVIQNKISSALRVPKEEKALKTFKEGIVENIPNLVKRITTNRINPKKSTPKRIMIKLPKTKHNGKKS